MKKLNAQVIIFNQENNEIIVEDVLDNSADLLETKTGIYTASSAKTYVDLQRQKLMYVIDVDLPAKVEAENLKLLRRSVTLKGLFNFERQTSNFNLVKLMPWIIILALILFK